MIFIWSRDGFSNRKQLLNILDARLSQLQVVQHIGAFDEFNTMLLVSRGCQDCTSSLEALFCNQRESLFSGNINKTLLILKPLKEL